MYNKYKMNTTNESVNNINSDSIEQTENNNIFFYSEVTRENILCLIKSIRKVDQENIISSVKYNREGVDDIWLHVNSFGGCVFSGLNAKDVISSCKSYVNTVVNGISASAGTFLTIAGQSRYITKSSYMLIHQLSSVHWGTYENFKDEKKNLDKIMHTIRSFYLENTYLKKKKLDKILKRDLYFDAEECIKYGLADLIID
jgi:ATP-dependent Clp protease protease subunit